MKNDRRQSAKGWPIWVASGGINFFGQGWLFHQWLKWLHKWVLFWLAGLTWLGALKVFKTSTLYLQAGNMPLDQETLMPTERFPKCIYVRPWQWLLGVALNAVGLSGPGFKDLLERGFWQKLTEYFQISLMPIGPKETWEEQWRGCLRLLGKHFKDFLSPFGLQLNGSCPNVRVGEAMTEIVEKILRMLDAISEFPFMKEVEVFVKIAVTMSPADAARIAAHPNCAGLVVSNTVPFGWFGIPKWKWLFWFPFSLRFDFSAGWRHLSIRLVSPLAKFGGGGLSGAGLFPLLVKWLKEFRTIDSNSYVNAGGGILKAKQVDRLFAVGANSISIGSIAFLRWWRMADVIEHAYLAFHRLVR
ncbi:MAG: hypothetical protein NTY66_01960 [Candidatus Vogelbacteria bacterium]|nr:hypothetical protein [Candidatus Vogelbacteria bacterium]